MGRDAEVRGHVARGVAGLVPSGHQLVVLRSADSLPLAGDGEIGGQLAKRIDGVAVVDGRETLDHGLFELSTEI
jgi:hypothetical protein